MAACHFWNTFRLASAVHVPSTKLFRVAVAVLLVRFALPARWEERSQNEASEHTNQGTLGRRTKNRQGATVQVPARFACAMMVVNGEWNIEVAVRENRLRCRARTQARRLQTPSVTRRLSAREQRRRPKTRNGHIQRVAKLALRYAIRMYQHVRP